MAKQPLKSGKDWSKEDVSKLRDLARSNTPTGLIAYKLGRSDNAIRSKASKKGISLKPTNTSPYNRRSK